MTSSADLSKLAKKTDLQIRTKAGATSEMGAIFDLILQEL